MAVEGYDMLVNLTNLPDVPQLPGVRLKRALPGDCGPILAFIQEHFGESWKWEAQSSLMQHPAKCFIATEGGKILGFAAFDGAAKGFFGPIGVDPAQRKRDIGKALLIRTLHAMREAGYGYAVIGWAGDSVCGFYKKAVNAMPIPGGEPLNSVYSRSYWAE